MRLFLHEPIFYVLISFAVHDVLTPNPISCLCMTILSSMRPFRCHLHLIFHAWCIEWWHRSTHIGNYRKSRSMEAHEMFDDRPLLGGLSPEGSTGPPIISPSEFLPQVLVFYIINPTEWHLRQLSPRKSWRHPLQLTACTM